MARILVVEDVEETRESLTHTLQSLGHITHAAHDGLDAEDYLEGGQYDLVITDIMMPFRNGFDVIRMAKAKHDKSKFLAISGGGPLISASFSTSLAQIKGHRSLKKPFTRQQFIGVVNDLLLEPA
jgi:CheY-like chemotaxis protein